MYALLDQREPIVASEAEAIIARAAAGRLKSVADARQDVQIVVKDQTNVVVPLPARAVAIILEVLQSMASKTPFSIIPHDAELTTQQAADFLNVSRPFLIGLLDQGKIDYRKVGTHRRIRYADLLEFEKASRAEREAAIAEMIAESQRLGLD